MFLFVVTLTDSEMVDMAMHLRKCVDIGVETNGGTNEERYMRFVRALVEQRNTLKEIGIRCYL